jgi:hypothetical protein
MKDNIIIYENKNGKVELRADIEKDTIWATQEQISELFECERSVITKHIRNIIKDQELQEKSICANFAHMGANGQRYNVKCYNLDAIIAVCYRVNSKKATQFRIWATGVLYEYLKQGYALNRYRLDKVPEAVEGLNETLALMGSPKYPGKLRGKLVFKLTKHMEPKK